MASICCELFEEKVVASLCRPYNRSDNKLTMTERERLSNSFSLTWRFLMENIENSNGLHERLASLDTKEIFRVREAAIFIVDNIPEPQRLEMARLMKDDDKWDETSCLARLRDIVAASNDCLESRGRDRWSQPDKAPLGLFSMFDHWQDDYMEQFE